MLRGMIDERRPSPLNEEYPGVLTLVSEVSLLL